MLRKLQESMIKKELKIQKAPSVQGAVCIHFQNKEVKDIILNDFSIVDVFKRINITAGDIRKSNIQQLLLRGDLIVV